MSLTRTRHRGVTAVAGAASLALVLAACGGGDTGDDGATAGDDAQEQVTLDWWSWNPDLATADPFIEAFEAEHENIDVNFRFIQYSDYAETVRLALTSDSGPDVFGLQVGVLTEQFAPLALDLAPYAEEQIGEDWAERLTASDQFLLDGKQVGLPWFLSAGGFMWANQTVVDELGLTIPTTYEELEAFVAAAEEAGVVGLVHGGMDAWHNLDAFQIISNQIESGYFYDAIAGEQPFDSPEMVEAFEVWQSLFTDGILPPDTLATTAYPQANDMMKKGEAALILMGSWQFNDITNTRLQAYAEQYNMPEIADTVFMPYDVPGLVPDADLVGDLFGGPDVGWGISAQSDDPDAAFTFVQWLTATEGGQNLIGDMLRPPVISDAEMDLSDAHTEDQVEAVEAFVARMQDLVGARELTNADVKQALSDALSAVASQQQSPADAAAAVQAVIDSTT